MTINLTPNGMNFTVSNQEEARQVIATLLWQFGSEETVRRIVRRARGIKQSTQEVTERTAGNLLTSFKPRKG